MTKSQHNDMLKETTESINSSLEDLIKSGDYPNITEIGHNKDFTEFTVTTQSTDYDASDALSIIQLYIYAGMYHIYNGTEGANIVVTFVNAESGEILETINSSDNS